MKKVVIFLSLYAKLICELVTLIMLFNLIQLFTGVFLYFKDTDDDYLYCNLSHGDDCGSDSKIAHCQSFCGGLRAFECMLSWTEHLPGDLLFHFKLPQPHNNIRRTFFFAIVHTT